MANTLLVNTTSGAGFGGIVYNGYTWTAIRHVKVIRTQPLYDEAQRAVKALECTLSIHGTVRGATVSDQQTKMRSVLLALNEPRKTLTITNLGWIDINTDIGATAGYDPTFGPFPRVVACHPVGADLAWEVEWEVTFTIPPLCAQTVSLGQVMAFNYEIFYGTNSEGLVTRTLAGYMEFVQYSIGNRIAFNPEAAFDRLKVGQPEFMRRVGTTRRFNAAKNRVEFSITDEEMADAAYPDGIIEADVTESMENRPPGFTMWGATLSGTLRVAPGYPSSLAATKFFLLMFDFAARMRTTAASSKNGFVIPERISFAAQKFGRTTRFAVTYRIVACLHDILSKSGLWNPVAGTSYRSWQTSMNAVGVNNLRGASNVKFNGIESIISLCEPAEPIIGNDTGGRTNPNSSASLALACATVTKEQSYLLWENKLVAMQNSNVVIQDFAQKGVGLANSPSDNGNYSQMAAPSQTPYREKILQYQGSPGNLVLMQGRALRLNFAAEVPVLESVGGHKVTILAANVVPDIEAAFFDCPLHSLRWAILYHVTGQLSTIKPPNRREMCFLEGEPDGRK